MSEFTLKRYPSPFKVNRQSLQFNGLRAWWPMHNAGTRFVYDAVGGHTGNLTNYEDVSDGWTYSDQMQGHVLNLTGESNYIGITNRPAFTFEDVNKNSFTISAWVRTTESGGPQCIVQNGSPGSSSESFWGLWIVDNKAQFEFNCDGGVSTFVISGVTDVNDGEWHHLVGMRNRADLFSLYVDGNLEGTEATDPGNLICTVPEEFGKSYVGDYYIGQLYDIRFYDRALSDAEVSMMGSPAKRWSLWSSTSIPTSLDLANLGPYTYNEIAQGGCVAGSTAANTLHSTNTSSGGITAGSTASVHEVAFNSVTGGSVGSGQVEPQVVFNKDTSGGATLSADVIVFGGNEEPVSGGSAVGGGYDIFTIYQPVISGGVVLSASEAESSQSYNQSVSGGIVAAGDSTVSNNFVPPLSGGIVAAGVAEVSMSWTVMGGANVGGESVHTVVWYLTSQAAVEVGGHGPERQMVVISDEASGDITVSGSSNAAVTSAGVGTSGGIEISNAQNPSVCSFRFIKKIELTWNRQAEIKKEIGLVWNTGRLNMYWYRVVGKGTISDCIPQDPCCQKVVLNVHARSLSELCEKLSRRRFKFPIASVHRFSRPAETSVVAAEEAAGVNHDCNVLQEVEVCQIPQCADFCVDQDLTEEIGFTIKVQVDAFKEYTSTGSAVITGKAGVVFTPYKPAFSAEGSNGISVIGDADCKTDHITTRGGLVCAGNIAVQASSWTYVGGVWPDTTTKKFATVSSSVAYPGEQPWSLTDRIMRDESAFTSTDISYGKTSQYILAQGFGLNLPEWAEVLSIHVSVDRLATQVGIRDKEVYLVLNGQPISDNLAATTTDWPLIETRKIYGASGWRSPNSDIYVDNFTVDEINDPTFGVAIKVRARTSASTTLAKIDCITMEVLYQDPNGSVLTLSSDTGYTAISPAYHLQASGRVAMGGEGVARRLSVHRARIQSYGIQCGGSSVLSSLDTAEGGMILGGTAQVKPYHDPVEGGSSIGGEAEVTPYLETATGGISVYGESRDVVRFRIIAEGGLAATGAAVSPAQEVAYTSVGSIDLAGVSRVRTENWSYVSEGSSLSVSGVSQQVAGSIATDPIVAEFRMFVLQTSASFLGDVHIGDAVGVTESVDKCGCFSLPQVLDMSQNFARDNIFSKFLIRNGFSIGRILKLRYNTPNDSWQVNLHYKGVSADGNSVETWDLTAELQCTETMGGVGVGRNVWKLAVQIFRRNLTTHEDFDTRIIVGILPDTICNSSLKQLNFEIDFDTQSRFCVVDPDATVYQSSIFDNIGLFRNRDWIDSPNLKFRVSQSSTSRLQSRLDLSSTILS